MSYPAAKKRFGQNFLVDSRITDDLADLIDPEPGEWIYEIGPGHGALTRAVLARASWLTAVELDRDLAAILAQDMTLQGLRVIQADALVFDFAADSGGEEIRVIGNLPYNVATPLIFRMLSLDCRITDMHFMVQKEVGERLCAEPGGKHYGRLSITAQYRSEVEILAEVPPEAFWPVPKVTSCFVRFRPKELTPEQTAVMPSLEAVTKEAFSFRRKQLGNALRRLFTVGQLSSLAVNPNARPEDLSVAEYVRLAGALAQRDK